jgi:hypothetical protein
MVGCRALCFCTTVAERNQSSAVCMFLNLLIVLYPETRNNKMKFVGVDRIPIHCFPIRWYVESIIRYIYGLSSLGRQY